MLQVNHQYPLILASSSKYRQALLSRLQLPFDALSPNIDETPLINESPEELVKRLALAKANKISAELSNSIIIGSDQVAVFENNIIGKPKTYHNAIKQLQSFSGKKVEFLTAVAVVCKNKYIQYSDISKVTVQFKVLSDSFIKSYLKVEQPYDCAGSFKIESLGIILFESVLSDDPTSLEGLPLILLCQLLEKAGVRIGNCSPPSSLQCFNSDLVKFCEIPDKTTRE